MCGEEAKEDEIHDKEAGQKIAFSVQRFDKIVVGDREYSSIVLLCQLVLFSAEEVDGLAWPMVDVGACQSAVSKKSEKLLRHQQKHTHTTPKHKPGGKPTLLYMW